MAKKKYSVKQRFDYHRDRVDSCGKYGLKFGSPKHCYSDGFVDAFSSRDNSRGITSEFGENSGKAYRSGYERGRKAATEYYLTTGKQPSSLRYK